MIDFFMAIGIEEDDIKEKFLSITYDSNVALQKRVEELEAALELSIREMSDLLDGLKVHRPGSYRASHTITQCEKLLTPKP